MLARTSRRWLRRCILLFAVFVAVCYIFTFSVALAWLRIPTAIGSVLGAGSLTYFMTLTGVLVIYQLLSAAGKMLPAETDPGRRRALNAAGSALMAAPFAAVGYGSFIQRTDFRVREVDLSLTGLAPDLEGLRILHLSDIHMAPDQRAKQEWLRGLADLEPDLVVDTGDNLAHMRAVPVVADALGGLLDVPGVYVLGSNDYYAPGMRNPLLYLLPDTGKRNTSMHLRSGGEKALTAISLVFALFQLNPAPFCLLDEVDAPLDDPNTDRFCAMVRQMAEVTQFLFISHNKITMEMANQLVGITMPDPGVSRVVAVDIAEALELAEATS